MFKRLSETLAAYQARDPAARSKLEIFLLYPGVIKVVFGDPISPEGKTPHELNEEVRSAIEGEMKLISPKYYK